MITCHSNCTSNDLFLPTIWLVVSRHLLQKPRTDTPGSGSPFLHTTPDKVRHGIQPLRLGGIGVWDALPPHTCKEMSESTHVGRQQLGQSGLHEGSYITMAGTLQDGVQSCERGGEDVGRKRRLWIAVAKKTSELPEISDGSGCSTETKPRTGLAQERGHASLTAT